MTLMRLQGGPLSDVDGSLCSRREEDGSTRIGLGWLAGGSTVSPAAS